MKSETISPDVFERSTDFYFLALKEVAHQIEITLRT